jgi:hypothetical protein
VSALIVIGGTCITADPGWAGRETLKAAAPATSASRWRHRPGVNRATNIT